MLSSSGWLRLLTGRTGRGAILPVIGPATFSSRRCTGRISPAAPSRGARMTACGSRGSGSRPPSVAPRRRTNRRRPSAMPASPTQPANWSCSTRRSSSASAPSPGTPPCACWRSGQSRSSPTAPSWDGFPRPSRLLPPFATEHLHRRSHSGDARRRTVASAGVVGDGLSGPPRKRPECAIPKEP